MKTVDGLEKDYEEYEIGKNLIDNYSDFEDYMSLVISDTEGIVEDTFKQILENNRWKKISKIRNLFPVVFVKEDIDFYDYDNGILLDASDLLLNNLEYYQRIRDISNESNFLELSKLTNFLIDMYEENIKYLNQRREKLNASYRGIEVESKDFDYNSYVVNEFANKHISSFEKQKQYVKK